ncbi:hypothetical protein SAMN02910354_00178 [Basfia succiniciproducens]|uniref:Lipoprotein n=1 Tax=Basfia succiniciproducens TaxID=653940 RepID=A0A1G5ADH2_9PAST|nr:hypothetical protein SAMN02910354_00178 [Basfia succiniciproducens]
MIKKLFLLVFIFLLSGCFLISLTPSYSSKFRENTWVHKETRVPLSKELHIKCRESIENSKEEDKLGEVYASCLRKHGFVFNASYMYCYKFKSICEEYYKYRN